MSASQPPLHYSITTARGSSSRDRHNRQRNYMIAMSIRMVCFLAIFILPGPLMWVALAGAIFLPLVAVGIANNVGESVPLRPQSQVDAQKLHHDPRTQSSAENALAQLRSIDAQYRK